MSTLLIQGGTLKRHKIWFHHKWSIRPTTALVRSTLFNWLSNDLHGYYCLDLFAGSGALGWESLSHGAAAVYLIERSNRICFNLNQQLIALDKKHIFDSKVRIIHSDAMVWIKRGIGHRRMDLIFIDPPYQGDYLERSLDLLYNNLSQPNALVDKNTIIYYETDVQGVNKLGHDSRLVIHKEAKRGQTYFGLLRLVV